MATIIRLQHRLQLLHPPATLKYSLLLPKLTRSPLASSSFNFNSTRYFSATPLLCSVSDHVPESSGIGASTASIVGDLLDYHTTGTSKKRFVCYYSKSRVISIPQSLPFPSDSAPEDSSLAGLEDVLASYVFGKKKATEVAHKVWEQVVRKGDLVIDATCGNGYDTLKLLKMVADESQQGRVYGLDVQKAALDSTSSLLEQSVSSNEKELVKLFQKCHSKMADILPEDSLVRLVAFNLGYLPGGDKTIITEPQTTLEALKVSKDILMPGGLISLVVYVGHPGGGQELKTVEEFSSELPIENWISCKFQMLNRPLSPVLIFLFKKW